MAEIVDMMDHVWKNGKKYTLAEFKEELKHELRRRADLDGNADVSKCVLALGEAGVGKTQAIRQAVGEIQGEYVMYHHGATMEEDNAGTPYQEQTNGNRVTKIAIPDHLACFYREPEGETGALVIEEVFTGSTTAHQNQARQFIDGRFGLTKMFPGWHIVGTSNPATAEFHTVKAVDKALAKRMIWLPVDPSSEEKLEYWVSRMHPLLHKFLVLWYSQSQSVDYVKATDSRTWMNLSDSIGRRCDVKTGYPNCPVKMLYRLMHNHVGLDVASSFEDYLNKGNDPNEYPIGHLDFLKASSSDVKILIRRVERWVEGDRTSLIGATQWGLEAYLRDQGNHSQVDDQGASNLTGFLRASGEHGYADMADSLMHLLRNTPLGQKVMKNLEGTNLEDRVTSLSDKIEKVGK